MQSDPYAESKIVFFDGVCGFCDRSVDFLVRIDRSEVLRFAPLQGPYARQVLPLDRVENLDTIVYKDGATVYCRSAALLRILHDLGGIWSIFYPLIWVPEGWRDAGYRWFAKRRYAFFGKREVCRLPSPEERARFIA